MCTECAWEAAGAARWAPGPKGTNAASSDASASLGALAGVDPLSLRAASVTLMHSRGQPSRLCRLQHAHHSRCQQLLLSELLQGCHVCASPLRQPVAKLSDGQSAQYS